MIITELIIITLIKYHNFYSLSIGVQLTFRLWLLLITTYSREKIFIIEVFNCLFQDHLIAFGGEDQVTSMFRLYMTRNQITRAPSPHRTGLALLKHSALHSTYSFTLTHA